MLAGADGNLSYRLLVSAPLAFEVELRSYLASLTRLDNVVEGSVGLPVTRQQHDQLTGSFPRRQYRVQTDQFFVDDVYLACDFQVWPRLNGLLAEARVLGYRLGYQINLRQWSATPDVRRLARKNLVELRNLRGVPGSIVEMQETLVENVARASCLVEEILAVDSEIAANWLSSRLAAEFARDFGSRRFQTPEFAFAEDALDEVLTLGVHSSVFEEPSLAELSATAIDSDHVSQVLTWRPPAEFEESLSRGLTPGAPRGEDAEAVTVDAYRFFPSPYQGKEQFVFVSYSHRDVAAIGPILAELQKDNIKFWYDGGIPGGEEWDAKIEERLLECDRVLLFVSTTAVNSKYVRREIKYADTINKSVISVRLEQTDLSHGLAMLLTQYQMLDLEASNFHQKVLDAIRGSN
jgi:hypothetical protein